MRKIVLLRHINEQNNDIKVLGCFVDSCVEEYICKYNKLPGFSDNNGSYIYNVSTESNNSYVYLLQIWSASNDDDILFIDLFGKHDNAVKAFQKYSNDHPELIIDSIIEKYNVNEMHWAEGFVLIDEIQ